MQARRQGAVAFQVALEAGRQVFALGQAGRQTLEVGWIVEPIDDDADVRLAEGVALGGQALALVVAQAAFSGGLAGGSGFPFAFVFAPALSRRCRRGLAGGSRFPLTFVFAPAAG